MRHRSPEKAKEHRARIAMLRRTTHGPERCQWPGGCANEAVDADERLLRSQGGSITDRDNLQLLCRTHHDWKHDHPAEAEALGVYVRATCSPNVNDACTVPAMAERRPIALRVSDAADQWVTARARAHNTSRSVVLRAMLSVATAHPEHVDAKIAALTEVDTP